MEYALEDGQNEGIRKNPKDGLPTDIGTKKELENGYFRRKGKT